MIVQCEHNWVKGPFYITAAFSFEEPHFYPPQGILHVEHCTMCGLIRIPEHLRTQTGENLGGSFGFADVTPTKEKQK